MSAWGEPDGTAVTIGRKFGDEWHVHVELDHALYLDHRQAMALATAVQAAAGECWARNGRELLARLERDRDE